MKDREREKMRGEKNNEEKEEDWRTEKRGCVRQDERKGIREER